MTDHVDYAQRWQDAQGYHATRAVLRDAAHTMIREGGLEGLSMRALAARVGTSAMAAYRYYPGKDTLVHDIRNHITRDFALRLQVAVAAVPDPVAKFRSMGAAYLDYALRNEEDYRVMFGAVAVPIVDPAVASPMTPTWHVLMRVLADLPNAEPTDRTIDQAHLVWSTMHGLVMLHLSGRLVVGRSIEQLLEPFLDFLLAALRVA